MARVGVDTYLAAHREQMPEEAWHKRKAEFTYAVSQQSWEQALSELADNPAGVQECIYVAEDETTGEIIGLTMGYVAETDTTAPETITGEICSIYVREGHQGQGIGSRLIRAAAGHLAREWGVTSLRIGALKANLPARRFYESLGGRVIAEREFDEEGFLLPGVVYGWPDVRALIGRQTAAGEAETSR